MRFNLGSSKTSNFIAIFALILSLFASIFSYIVYIKSEQELLSIASVRVGDGYKVEIDTAIINFSTISILWECVLTNNGKQTSSLIAKNIKLVNSNRGILYYSNMDLGLIKDNNINTLPFNILPGESVKFYIKIGVLIDSLAAKTLKKNVADFSKLTPRKIQYYLALDSIDVFGNKINAEIYPGEKLSFSLPRDFIQNIYELEFKTGRGQYIRTKLKWYPEFGLE